ncbi:hypothetical protein BKP64_04630 [Marinobacter salinus]|uniref:Uncharacterized protein n=2 Tax=Marinobacter salinus TaxID=1874317 RepID=A0A1D9GJ13_9GAMM|nr:hypothetical protein BKP64_04630 [Marinobacter salinus]
MYRESSSNQWNSDSQLVKLLDQGVDELYVEFYIRFSDNWWHRANYANYASKMFRIGHWDGVRDLFNGALGGLGPLVFWDYKRDQYGMSNFLSFRGGPGDEGNNYYLNGEYPDYVSLGYGYFTLEEAPGGTDPLVVNQVEGGYLKDIGRYDPITHEQVFGTTEHWTKLGFYVRMNSAIGAADGIFRMWVNDQRIVNREKIPFVQPNTDNAMLKWNYIAIGGNDNFFPYPADQLFEDWYAIDNIVVRSDMPVNLGVSDTLGDVAPTPPSDLVVE